MRVQPNACKPFGLETAIDQFVEEIGDCVIVEATFHAVGSGSGIELNQAGYHVWRIRDGKGVEFRFFLDRDEAVAAARES